MSVATLQDVAKRARVSIATVSHVLNDTKQVTASVRERVLKAASDLNYRANHFGRSLRTGTSRTLGAVVPDLTNPFFPELLQSIETTARSLGYTLLLVDSTSERPNEHAALEILASQNVDGLIWVPINDHAMTEALPPTVVVSGSYLGSADTVYSDQRKGGKLQAQAAIDHGHTKIALLSGPQSTGNSRDRRKGFLDEVEGRTELLWEQEVPFSLTLPQEAAELLQQQDFSLVVAANDTIAIAALRVLLDAGIKVPEEVSIIGFDDIALSSLVTPPLTTVRQPIRDLGARAVRLLHKRITEPDGQLCHEILDVELIERRSLIRLNEQKRLTRKEKVSLMPD
jgi:LacI family transcriptional regulator